MKCCIECFKDSEIRSVIQSFGQASDCDFCSSKNVSVYDVDVVPSPIADMIISLIETYSISNSDDAKMLKVSLRDDWNVFNAGVEVIQMLVQKLCASVYSTDDEIFTKKVIIPKISDATYLEQFCIVKGHSWQDFANSIKYSNRFHSKVFCADAFIYFLEGITKTYPIGTHFYRARISGNKDGFPIGAMGAPPQDKRSAGRVNPEGIGILYLSSDDKTVLNEIRATMFDFVSIGTFELLKDIKIVNLSGISKTSPFSYQGELERYAVNRDVFPEIAQEIAKPLRRSDSPLEYLPTQYIAEFIKSQGYDGVEFTSTLREEGNNIAAFDDSLFKCIDVKTVEISKIQYEIR